MISFIHAPIITYVADFCVSLLGSIIEDGYRWEQVANNKWVTYLHRNRATTGGEIAQIIPIFAEIPLSGMEVELLADKWMEENGP